jgi:hypothetical protein
MSDRVHEYYSYVLSEDQDIVRELQTFCADIHEKKQQQWTDEDVRTVVGLFSRSKDPKSLFRFMDERTGTSYVGYRTPDNREWFHILRQMRNDSDLFHDLLYEASGSPR